MIKHLKEVRNFVFVYGFYIIENQSPFMDTWFHQVFWGSYRPYFRLAKFRGTILQATQVTFLLQLWQSDHSNSLIGFELIVHSVYSGVCNIPDINFP